MSCIKKKKRETNPDDCVTTKIILFHHNTTVQVQILTLSLNFASPLLLNL